MAAETRHMHILELCRVHPNEMEITALGKEHGVFDTMEQVEAALDDLVDAREGLNLSDDEKEDLIEHRGPGLLMIKTMGATDSQSMEMGGDGRCHRLFTQVWCIGDPEECRESLERMAAAKVSRELGQLLQSVTQDRAEDLLDKMMQDLMNMAREAGLDVEAVRDGPDMIIPPRIGFGTPEPKPTFANEPWDEFDFDDFGGFDEPTNPKRLN